MALVDDSQTVVAEDLCAKQNKKKFEVRNVIANAIFDFDSCTLWIL